MIKKLLALTLSILLCICITPQNVSADTTLGEPSSNVIDEIDLTDTLPENFGYYGNAGSLISYFYTDANFGEFSLYNNWDSIYCNELITGEDSSKSYERMDPNTSSFSVGGEYAIEIYLNAPEGSVFKGEYNESKDTCVYTGSFLPEVDDSLFTVGFIGDDGGAYINPSLEDPNGIRIFIPFTIEPISIIANEWSDIEDVLNKLLLESSSTPVIIKLNKDITADEGDSTFRIWEPMNVTIDLNGYVLNRNLINPDGTKKERPIVTGHDQEQGIDYSGSVFEVTRAKLTIKDSNPNRSHPGYVDANGLWHFNTGVGTPKTINGGIITGGIGLHFPEQDEGKGLEYGGGISINDYHSEVILEGGSICGNYVDGYGAGVAAYDNSWSSDLRDPEDRSKFVMNGGSICYNYASRDGAGIVTFQNIFEMNGGHIDYNHADGSGAAIFNNGDSDIVIKGGYICNNSGHITGTIMSMGDPLNLTADEGKEIVIKGNKSDFEGNVFSEIINISGKIIIKDNYCKTFYEWDVYHSIVEFDEETGEIIGVDEHIDPNTGNPFKILTFSYNNVWCYSGSTPFNVVGDLTGSDIYLFVAYAEDGAVITTGFGDNSGGSEENTFIHFDGSESSFIINEQGELAVSNHVKVGQAFDQGSFIEQLTAAEALHDQDPTITYKIELSGDIGSSEEPLSSEDFGTDPNTAIDLNGHSLYVDGEIFINEITDTSTGEKGKLYLKKPDDLTCGTSLNAEEDTDTLQEPVWTEVEEITEGEFTGYYCMYQVGAKTKWAEVVGGDNDDEAKFKVQPTAYDEILSLLGDDEYKDVYGNGKKVKVGLRLILDHSRDVNFVFEDELTNSWANGSPKVNCMIVTVNGLKPFKSVLGQAAIYSKPLDDKDSELINAQFFSNDNDRSAK